MNLKYKATVVCDHVDPSTDRGCNKAAVYEEHNIEGVTTTQFGDAAASHFRSLGWHVAAPLDPQTRCPAHA